MAEQYCCDMHCRCKLCFIEHSEMLGPRCYGQYGHREHVFDCGLNNFMRITMAVMGQDYPSRTIPEVTPGGAAREPKPGTMAHWCTLDYESVRGLAETNAEGDTRYGIDNWAKGIPASNLLNHALDHIFKLIEGDGSEPHIEHAMWNLGKLRWMAKNKPGMIDLPRIRKALKMEPR